MPLDALAFGGTPFQWAFLILVALLILSPRTLPLLARRFGDILFLTALRRVLPFQLPARAPRPSRHEMRVVEEEPPTPAVATLPTQRANTHRGLWAAGLIVSGVAVILMWYLLHSR